MLSFCIGVRDPGFFVRGVTFDSARVGTWIFAWSKLCKAALLAPAPTCCAWCQQRRRCEARAKPASRTCEITGPGNNVDLRCEGVNYLNRKDMSKRLQNITKRLELYQDGKIQQDGRLGEG